MTVRTPDPREYFTDEQTGGEYVTELGASMLLDCSRQSVHLTRQDASGMKPKSARLGRPVKWVVSLEEVVEEQIREGRGEKDGAGKDEPVIWGPAGAQAPPEVPSMREAKLRQEVGALTSENSLLKQRLEVVQRLLLEHMEAMARMLRLEEGTGSAS